MQGLELISHLRPANFLHKHRAENGAEVFILELLKNSISNNKIIQYEDIRLAHAKYSMKKGQWRCGFGYYLTDGSPKWRRATTLDEWMLCYKEHPSLVLAWFKRNLGEAIMRGRILALPIIDIN